MRIGDRYTITSGDYKGCRVRIVKVGKKECIGEVDGYQDNDDWCVDDGEEVVFKTPDPKQEMRILDSEILSVAAQLRGLILKKKSILDPVTTDKEIRKLLSCVEL
jgi:hypothetical protein